MALGQKQATPHLTGNRPNGFSLRNEINAHTIMTHTIYFY